MSLPIEIDVASVKQLRDSGARPPKHHPWGKTDFRLVDPDGYSLEFGTMDAGA